MIDGWYDGEGTAPQLEGLDWLADDFDRYYPDDIPLPHTYPTPEGGIEMEWSIGDHSVVLEIDLSARQAAYLGFDNREDGEDSRNLDLGSRDGWQWLAAMIRQFAESS